MNLKIQPDAWWKTIKKFLKSSPIQVNSKPVATWKVLLPVTLLILIPLLTFVVKQTTRPPTPDEIAQKEYEKAKEQANILSVEASKQTAVPKDETPNVATITDVNELQDQEFFKQAQNGDKILIYEKAKIIVLYRPGERRVIANAPVLYNQPAPNVAGTSSATVTASESAWQIEN